MQTAAPSAFDALLCPLGDNLVFGHIVGSRLRLGARQAGRNRLTRAAGLGTVANMSLFERRLSRPRFFGGFGAPIAR